MDTAEQMAAMVQGADGKRLPYKELIVGRVFKLLTDGGQEAITQER